MKNDYFEIESDRPFAESLIWQLNREFYQEKGISAWSDDIVPHHMTSNSRVGKTYAELIFAFLKDLAAKKSSTEVVYILELGAGHGRLAFHILKHLDQLIESTNFETAAYCYVLSDIVEENISFFHHHPQLQTYFQTGQLDLAYFHSTETTELYLRHAKRTIHTQELNQPIIAIANYFFDSMANDLFFIKDKVLSSCSVSLQSKTDPAEMTTEVLIKNMEATYRKTVELASIYQDPILNEMMEEYRNSISESYLFFPQKSIQLVKTLRALSKSGLMLLTMDKGFHEAHDLKDKKEPDFVTHGSFSFLVNFHALSSYCIKKGGKTHFPAYSNFHIEIGCLLFLKDSESFLQTDESYEQFVNNFGPDDFNSIKKLAYFNVSRLKLKELIALYRLSSYDSTIFIKLLPRLKQVSQTITTNERKRLGETMHIIWDKYFYINEPFDLAYEIGGLFYDLGFYPSALVQFQNSVDLFGAKADICYNQILCHYQMREDDLFFDTLSAAKIAFPAYDRFKELEKLEMD